MRPRVYFGDSAESLPLEDEIAASLDDGAVGLVRLTGLVGSGKTTAIEHLAQCFAGDERLVAADEPSAAELTRLIELSKTRLVVVAAPASRTRLSELTSIKLPTWTNDDFIAFLLSALVIVAGKSISLARRDREASRARRASHAAVAREALAQYCRAAQAEEPGDPPNTTVAELAPWSDDDVIECLLAAWPEDSRALFNRYCALPDRAMLGGRPALVLATLDRLANDVDFQDTAGALVSVVAPELSCPRGEAAQLCWRLQTCARDAAALQEAAFELLVATDAPKLLRHGLVRDALAVEHVVECVLAGEARSALNRPLPRRMVERAARLLVNDEPAHARLSELADEGVSPLCVNAAAILPRRAWRPNNEVGRFELGGAFLDEADWRGGVAHTLNVAGASLVGANLADLHMRRVFAFDACMRRVNLRGARIDRLYARGVDLGGADLSLARIGEARLERARLNGADLTGAMLRRAWFHETNLRDAKFVRCDLSAAKLVDADIAGADFSGAELRSAVLVRLCLRDVEMHGAQMHLAEFVDCDLEGVDWPGAKLPGAILKGAILTDSRMPSANLSRAKLRGAGLAGVEWERADLRGADLRECSFHLGSSRSGLIDSPIACEGSRLGFYTDDFAEQDFKAPEEIRKANLRGADLRGAKIDGVDFYLVDLRDALYDDMQARWFRKCRAILETRV